MIKDQILELSSQLSPEDLRELAQRFNEAADKAAPQEEIDAAWNEEIQRRRQSIRDGSVVGIPWEEIKRELKSGLHGGE